MPLEQLSECDVAYLAGIIDGEGTITLTRKHRGENRRAVVSISSTELPLLTHVISAVGMGRITRKCRVRCHHSPSFAYAVYSRQALALLARIWPSLRTYEAEPARLILERVHPRDSQEWALYADQRAARQAFKKRFFALSMCAKAIDKGAKAPS